MSEILNIFAPNKRIELKKEAEKYAEKKEHEASFGRAPATDYGWGEDDQSGTVKCACGEELVAGHMTLGSKLVCLVCNA